MSYSQAASLSASSGSTCLVLHQYSLRACVPGMGVQITFNDFTLFKCCLLIFCWSLAGSLLEFVTSPAAINGSIKGWKLSILLV